MRQKRKVPSLSNEVEQAIEKIKNGEQLTEEEDNMLLTPQETSAVLSAIKGSPVSVPYLSVLIQVGRLTPYAQGGGNSYRYKMSIVKQVKFNPRGNPNLREFGRPRKDA